MIIKNQLHKTKVQMISATLLLLFSLQAHAEKSMVIGTFAQMPPFSFWGVTDAEGFDVDLAQAIAKKQGWQIKILKYPFSFLTEGLNNNTMDLVVTSLLETPERKQNFEISEPYAHAEDALLYINPDIQIHEDSDLAGLKIAALENSVQLKTLINKLGVPPENIIPVKTAYLGYRALMQKKADAMIAYRQALDYLTRNKQGNFQFYTIKQIPPRRLIALGKKGNQQLLQQFNQGLEAIKKDGSYQKIYDKWFKGN